MKKFRLIAVLLCIYTTTFATHNRAGEITYKRIEPLTQVVGGFTVPYYKYLITVTKYNDHGNSIADRCVDTVYFGDGTSGTAARINNSNLTQPCCGVNCGSLIVNNGPYVVKVSIYTIEHVFPGPGTFVIHSSDFARNESVINMNTPLSQAFYIESTLVISNFTGGNTSVIFTNPPIDKACLGQCFYHNPGAFDADGDSLSYAITTSRGANGNTVNGYFFPPASSFFGIDAVTGKLSWCNPTIQGEYNIAFIVTEWRKSTNDTAPRYKIGTVMRDMQVVVSACANTSPPQFTNFPPDTCVEAGTTINKTITVTDTDTPITIQGSAGAYLAPSPIASPAQIIGVSGGTITTLNFTWTTTCSHISATPYATVFKATDGSTNLPLVNFQTYNIKVVPPSVKNVTATAIGSNINVSWQLSSCNPTNNPIVKYKIYRKDGCSSYSYSPCQTGVVSTSGFIKIGETNSTVSIFSDNNNGNGLVVGQNYSYLVVAVYFDGSQSFGSSAVCAQLKKDVPILLNVDVLSTSTNTGSVFIKWHKPYTNTGNFDTTAFPGPYQFNLKFRSGATGTYSLIFNSTKANFYLLDTQFIHTAINTTDINKDYIIEFIAGTVTIGSSQRANSVFLTANPADRKINLQWNSSTPWNNYNYTVYRKNPSQTTFTAIGTTTLTTFSDTLNIANRATYCYRVQSEGQYSDATIPKPLINNSQEVCATAIDLTPPCAPTITITADCISGNVKVIWNNVATTCNGSDDVVKYLLYYKPTNDGIYSLISTLSNPTSTVYFNDGQELISGCYAVTAVDSSNNESAKSTDFCIDNCPEFELPNIVTNNGDGVNDFFKARKVRQIKEIDLVVFDRWGNLVYKTTDPYFKWNCISILSNQTVSQGTFFYICDVFEPRVSGIKKRTLKGYMQVVK